MIDLQKEEYYQAAMSTKRILLARPNSFIVDEMKRLIADSGYTPTPINDLEELMQYDTAEIGGAVISTAFSSTVKEDYHEVVKAVIEKFTGIPVMLATLIDVEAIRKAIDLKFEAIGLDFEMHSMEMAGAKGMLTPRKDMIIIQKNDIADEAVYARTLKTVKQFFL
jgi:hypothetical protein